MYLIKIIALFKVPTFLRKIDLLLHLMMNMTEVILTEMDLVVIEMVEMTDLTGTIAMTTDQIEITDLVMILRRGNRHRNHI